MNDLLNAAKAVIDAEFVSQQKIAREKLRIAIERAESCQPVRLSDDAVVKLWISSSSIVDSEQYQIIAKEIMDAMLEKNQ